MSHTEERDGGSLDLRTQCKPFQNSDVESMRRLEKVKGDEGHLSESLGLLPMKQL